MSTSFASPQDKLIPAWLQPATALDLLSTRGIELEPALRGTTLFIQDSPFSDHAISPWQHNILLHNCKALWPTDDFCFVFGHRVAETGLGPLADLLKEQTSSEKWSHYFYEFSRIICPSLCARIHKVDDTDHLILVGSTTSIKPNHEALQACFATCSYIIKREQPHLTIEFFFEDPEPKAIEQYHTYLNGTCHFNAPFTGIRIRHKCHDDTAVMHSIRIQASINQCRQLCGEQKYLLETLSNMLWYSPNSNLGLQDCAQHLDISIATLKRRLSEHQCSFQQLSDLIRREKAILGLLTKNNSADRLSTELSFHDTSNFRRAFKRWTGMTPKALKLAYQGWF